MKAFESNIETVVKRFFLMMAVVIFAGFIGQWWLAIFALPILLSAMMSVRFTEKKTNSAKSVKLEPKRKEMKEAI